MDPTAAPDAFLADPRLDALERAPTAALLIAADGIVAWANAAGRSLGVGDRLDRRSSGAVAGLAGPGLLRLRIGAAGRFEPLGFRGTPIAIGDASFLLLEALSPPARKPWAPQPAASPLTEPAPEAERETADGDPLQSDTADPAAAESAAFEPNESPGAEAIPSPDGLDDRPPDPRGDMPAYRMATRQETETAAPGAPAVEPEADEPATRPNAVRFVFEIDAEGRLSFLSPDLAETVGRSATDSVGRLWSEVAHDLALDPAGAVNEALAGRTGWRGLEITWPAADGGRLPLALSALPVFDRGRTFIGFRGLGTGVDRPAAEKLALLTLENEPASELDASAPTEPVTAATVEPSEAEAVLTPRYEPPVFAPSPPREVFSGNVVALHDLPEPRPALSSGEESAFDEIARRLAEASATANDAANDDVSARAIWEDIAADAEMSLGDDEVRSDSCPADAPAPADDDLRRLLDRMPVGALVLRDGLAVFANRAALDMTGCDDVARLAARGRDALFSEPLVRHGTAPSAVRLIAEDGAEVRVEAKLSAIPWDGAPATVILLRPAEGPTAALIASHEREKELSAILDTATDGVLTLDGAGRVLSINRSAEALLGYDAREIVGSLFSLALAPESRRTAYEYLDGLKTSAVAALLNDGREVLGLVRQGGAIPLYLTLGRIGAPEDNRYCAVLRDITHWKKAEEELLAARRQAERASAQKSDFLAKVSHEIRTPLNAIIGFAEVMMEERFGAVGNERYKDYLRDIHLSGGHIVSLVNDLLDLSKIESGKLELTFVDVDLNETVSQAVALLQPQANRERIIIRTSLARSLPKVRADQRSIRQIVLNLASNAVKFTQGGGQVIVATALNDLGEPVIRVRDNGVGMSRRDVALALEPFRQSPLGGQDGAGLGLPLTKALAEANQASFAIQSAVGEGTLVEVTFSAMRATG